MENTLPTALGEAQGKIWVVYHDAVTNIMFIKRERLAVLYYTMLLYGALITIRETMSHDIFHAASITEPERTALFWFAIANFLSFVVAQFTLNNYIKRFRERVRRIHLDHFSADERDSLYIRANPKGFWYDFPTIFLLVFCSVCGLAISEYTFFRDSPASLYRIFAPAAWTIHSLSGTFAHLRAVL